MSASFTPLGASGLAILDAESTAALDAACDALIREVEAVVLAVYGQAGIEAASAEDLLAVQARMVAQASIRRVNNRNGGVASAAVFFGAGCGIGACLAAAATEAMTLALMDEVVRGMADAAARGRRALEPQGNA